MLHGAIWSIFSLKSFILDEDIGFRNTISKDVTFICKKILYREKVARWNIENLKYQDRRLNRDFSSNLKIISSNKKLIKYQNDFSYS